MVWQVLVNTIRLEVVSQWNTPSSTCWLVSSNKVVLIGVILPPEGDRLLCLLLLGDESLPVGDPRCPLVRVMLPMLLVRGCISEKKLLMESADCCLVWPRQLSSEPEFCLSRFSFRSFVWMCSVDFRPRVPVVISSTWNGIQITGHGFDYAVWYLLTVT